MLNSVHLIGNLGADPDTRTSASGVVVCNLRVATTHRAKDDDGNWSDRTEWHRVVCFGKTAENAGRFLEKGRQVFIDGRLQTRKWTDQNGSERYSTEVVAREVKFLGGKEARSAQDRPPRQTGQGAGYRPPKEKNEDWKADPNDPLPF